MKRLILECGIYEQLCSLAVTFEGEFAVTLFGEVRGDDHVIAHIAPPGEEAINGLSHCSNDAEFEAQFFERLLKDDPGITWLGDLHAHPPGCPWLSRTDRHTIRRLLLDNDADVLHPTTYVAGVILRAGNDIAIYPSHFTPTNLEGSEMEVCNESLCEKPA